MVHNKDDQFTVYFAKQNLALAKRGQYWYKCEIGVGQTILMDVNITNDCINPHGTRQQNSMSCKRPCQAKGTLGCENWLIAL